jgi:hypothetical protein
MVSGVVVFSVIQSDHEANSIENFDLAIGQPLVQSKHLLVYLCSCAVSKVREVWRIFLDEE